VSQTESVTNVPGAPSCRLLSNESVGAATFVKLMNDT
jgi:hypothetical protein